MTIRTSQEPMTLEGARERVAAYVAAYRKMSGLHPDEVHSVARDGQTFTLLIADLAALANGEGLDVERLARAMDACLPESFLISQPGNAVRAKAITREYAALRASDGR